METVAINIALLLSDNAQAKFIELSRLTGSKADTYFTLNETKYIPHLSLYHAQYVAKNRKKVIDTVARIAQTTKSLELAFSGYSNVAEYVYVNAAKIDELTNLHQQILDLCNPFREGLIPESVDELIKNGKLSETQIKTTLQYGHPLAGAFFQPHVTLTRTRTYEAVASVLESLPKVEINTKIKQIAMVNIGPHGTCNKVFETFPLQ